MKQLTTALTMLTLAAFVSACDQESIANRGFSLPIGDAENGRVLFKQHGCVECHTVAGNGQEYAGIGVKLGGTTSKVQTYGDLVTSIINPSHRLAEGYPLDEISEDGQSKMRYYNQVLTVEDLVDLVTYLKSQYKLRTYPETAYPPYVYAK